MVKLILPVNSSTRNQLSSIAVENFNIKLFLETNEVNQIYCHDTKRTICLGISDTLPHNYPKKTFFLCLQKTEGKKVFMDFGE